MGVIRALILGLGLSLSAAPAPAADAPGKAPGRTPNKATEVAGELVKFRTRDGWTISGKYWPASDGEMTFILLHDQKGRHQDWRKLTVALARRGVGYLAFDLRGHGLSQTPPKPGQASDWRRFTATKAYNEWDNMREDAAAAVEVLKSRGVSDADIAFGGGDIGGSIALKYAAVHLEVPMIFLLSPGISYHDVTTVNAMRSYKDRPILMIVAEDDPKCAAETTILAQFARNSAGPDNVTLLRVPHRHGTLLLHNKDTVENILAWIDNPVKSPGLESPALGSTEPGSDGLPTEDQLDRAVHPDAGR